MKGITMPKSSILRILSVILCLALLGGGLMGCTQPQSTPEDDGVLTVICTNYAGYEFARSVLPSADTDGQEAAVCVSLLGRVGQDMHSYEPSAGDIITLAAADIVVSVGDTAEPWLAGALSSSGNTSVRRVDMMAVCGVEGEVHDEDCELDHDHDHEHHDLTDEHVWVSVKNAEKISRRIADTALEVIGDTNAALAEDIAAARDTYCAELAALDRQYTEMVASAKRTELLMADRYPFAHLMADYGLTCHAAFPGCSSETEASFATQAQLIETVKALGLPYIFVIDGSDRRVAETVAEATGAQILLLHSCQVITEGEMAAGLSYLDIAEANLENLRKALCEG